jgi:hypothetical protein
MKMLGQQSCKAAPLLMPSKRQRDMNLVVASNVTACLLTPVPLLQASLKALQVLLERVAPSASPLLRRLPVHESTHHRISTLLDFLVARPSNAVHHTDHGDSALSSDLKTNEVLFAMDTSGLVTVSEVPTVDTQTTGTCYDGTIVEGSFEGTYEESSLLSDGRPRTTARSKRFSGCSTIAAACRAGVIDESDDPSRMSVMPVPEVSQDLIVPEPEGISRGGTLLSTSQTRVLESLRTASRRSPSQTRVLESPRTVSVPGTHSSDLSGWTMGGTYQFVDWYGTNGAPSTGRWNLTPQTIFETALSEVTNTPHRARPLSLPHNCRGLWIIQPPLCNRFFQ